MNTTSMKNIFTENVLDEIFPAERSNQFFEALFGDASEGAYDIKLRFHAYNENTSTLQFYLDLYERPGCCLVCSLTYGLPEVFSRHPIINIKGVVQKIEKKIAGQVTCTGWRLGTTVQQEKSLHSIPLTIEVNTA
ncbi:MAG: pancreas/duodenum homeobox protein 1 [Desulfobulbales bacterium]